MLENLIVPVLNRYDLLQRMLSSLDYPIRHLLIIDNGASQNETTHDLDVPDVVEHITYLPMPANLGVAGSWNLGIKSFPHDNHWFFASNDMWFEPGGLQRLSESRSNGLVLADVFPHWYTFALGYEVVAVCGLFDEGFFPAYFEDNDMSLRIRKAGLDIRKIGIPSGHDNSSTINSDHDLQAKNNQTFRNNQAYYQQKIANGDYSEGAWSIVRRRANSWD